MAKYQCISNKLFPTNKNKERRQIQLTTATLNKKKSVVIDNTNPIKLWDNLSMIRRL